jgi:hypothetical protein
MATGATHLGVLEILWMNFRFHDLAIFLLFDQNDLDFDIDPSISTKTNLPCIPDPVNTSE